VRPILILALALVAGGLAACGGDDQAKKGPPGSESNPLVALPNPSRTRTPPTEAPQGSEAVAPPKRPAQARRPQRTATAQRGARSGSERAARTARKQPVRPASAQSPCSLVTKRQARAIIGAPIDAPLQAPQGPTCIYRAATGSQQVTLSVQTVGFAKLRKQLRDERAVRVLGRTAYCGTYGRRMLYLPLAHDRVLSIAAPCSTASRFAAKAAARL
jgi:hypothetical protein